MLHTTRKFAEYVPVFGALSETSLQTLFAAPPRCSDLLGVSRSRAGLAHGGGSSSAVPAAARRLARRRVPPVRQLLGL